MLSWLPALSKAMTAVPVVSEITPSMPVPVARGQAVRGAVVFLQSLIRRESDLGDQHGAMGLAGVLDVLHGLGRPTETLRRRAESDAYDFITDYTDIISETGASQADLDGLRLVANVLASADIARKQEKSSGQLCGFARIEEIYGTYYAQNSD